MWHFLIAGAVLAAACLWRFSAGVAAPNKHQTQLMREHTWLPPYPIFVVGLHLLACLHWLWQRLHPPALSALNIALGQARAQVLATLAELQVAEALAEGPKTAAELATELGLHAERLERLLQAAIAMGVFAYSSHRKGTNATYCNNSISIVLHSGHPNCVRHLVLAVHMTSKPGLHQLTWGLRTGGLMFEKATGHDLWDWLKQEPERDSCFNLGMAETDKAVGRSIVVDYSWGNHKRLVDMGGCYGSFLKALLLHWPKTRGVVFDQPHVIEKARTIWASQPELQDRAELVAGSFFDAATIPKAQDGDAFFMRVVLHDWNDAHTITILSNCRKAIGTADAKLLLVEATPRRGRVYDSVLNTALSDIHMMAAVDGAERSVLHWQLLLSEAGFRLGNITPSRSPFCIIECLPS